MAKPHTKPVKVGRFMVTSHAQNRLVSRDLTADCMIDNLCRKPMAIGQTKEGKKGPSYLRLNRQTTTAITPNNKNVTSIYQTNRKEAKKYGFTVERVELESQRRKRLAKEKALKKTRISSSTKKRTESSKTKSQKKRK